MLLAALFALPLALSALGAQWEVTNPYKNANWDTWGQHKGNFHTHAQRMHTTFYTQQVIDIYNDMGYSVLAITNHGLEINSKSAETTSWNNNTPVGQSYAWPWTNPWVDRDPEALNMIAVPGAEWAPDGHDTLMIFCPETTRTIAAAGQAGGLSVFAHPGRYSWTASAYSSRYKTYPHLIGQEVYSQGDRHPGDRRKWDQVLVQMLPDNRPVWGFSNDDFHNADQHGLNWNVMLMPELTYENSREALRNGVFFFAYASARGAMEPKVNRIIVDEAGCTIGIEAENVNPDLIEWWYNEAVIHRGATIDLAKLDPRTKYVRAIMYSTGGVVLGTQPFCLRYFGGGGAGNNGPEITTPASATPAIVTGTTAMLSVVASDSDNDALTYSWRQLSGPGSVSFTPNNTEESHSSAVTFSAPGTYELRVTVSDGGKFVNNSIFVEVARTPTAVTLTPATAVLPLGGSQQFTASVNDQFGARLAAGFTWSVDAGAGTVDATGKYCAPAAAGYAKVRATFTSNGTANYLSATGTVEVTVAGLAVWTNASGGSWPVAAHWKDNDIADGEGAIADFSTLDLLATRTVTLDGARTIGRLRFGDVVPSHDWVLSPGTVGPLTLASAADTPSIEVANQTAAISAVLAGTQGLVKSGGGTLALSGVNTLSGGIRIEGGTLQIEGAGEIAATTPIQIAAGATFRYSSKTLTYPGIISGEGGIAKDTSNHLTLTGTNTFSGPVVIGGGRLIVSSPVHLGQSTSISISGSGVLRIDSGSNCYPQDIILSGSATIRLASATGVNTFDGSLSGGSLLVDAAWATTSLKLTGVNTYTGKTSVPCNFEIAGAGQLGSGDYAGSIALGPSKTFTHSSSADQVLSGPISGSGSILVKSGAGTLTLGGDNTYTGATQVTGGALRVNGSLASVTSVATTATLGGTGAIAGPVSVEGTLAPGDAGPGGLTVNSTVTLAAGSAIVWQVADWSGPAGTGYDTLTAANLDIAATPAAPVTITISPDALQNFTEGSKVFTLVRTTGGVAGFVAENFLIDATGFSAGSGQWSVGVSGIDLMLAYTQGSTPSAFTSDPIALEAIQDTPVTGTLADYVVDPDAGDTLTFALVGEQGWLLVAPDGTLSGTPGNGDVRTNTFIVSVTDGIATINATLQIEVIAVNPDANGNGILDSWEMEKFRNADPGANLPNADPDGDGLSNLMEFALNTDPLVANKLTNVTDFVEVDGEKYLRLSVAKNPVATNLIYEIETSGDLVSWFSKDTVVIHDDENQLVARDSFSAANRGRRYIRLVVMVAR